jgi:hypothetical protein
VIAGRLLARSPLKPGEDYPPSSEDWLGHLVVTLEAGQDGVTVQFEPREQADD